MCYPTTRARGRNVHRALRAVACCATGVLAACARSNSAVSSPTPVPTSDGHSDVFVKASPATERSATLADFQPDLPAVDDPFECTGRDPIGRSGIGRELLGPDAVSFSAVFPSRDETRATVVVIVDSAGKIIRYAERRGPPIQFAAASRVRLPKSQRLLQPCGRQLSRSTMAGVGESCPIAAAGAPISRCPARLTSWVRCRNSATHLTELLACWLSARSGGELTLLSL